MSFTAKDALGRATDLPDEETISCEATSARDHGSFRRVMAIFPAKHD